MTMRPSGGSCGCFSSAAATRASSSRRARRRGEQLATRSPWDLAILDRRLPDMDGVDLCHELKSDPELRNRYIIMLTGEDEQEDKVEGLDLGADDYITKPFQYPELLARIRAAQADRRPAEGAARDEQAAGAALDHRRTDEALQPSPLPGRAGARVRGVGSATSGRCRWPSSTSISSRRSTTRTATPSATKC